MRPQRVELLAQNLVPGAGEQVAAIGVLGHQPQRLLLPHAADEDGRVGLAEGQGATKRLGQVEMLGVERLRSPGPHVVGQLQRLFQQLETLLQRRERKAQPGRFAIVPRRADAQVGAAAR